MIATIRGILLECQPNLAIVEVGGIGYEVHVPLTTSEKLPAHGKEIKLHAHATYREDAQTLYGFGDREARDFFRLIIDKVSGIGPRIALNLLGSLSLPTLPPRRGPRIPRNEGILSRKVHVRDLIKGPKG